MSASGGITYRDLERAIKNFTPDQKDMNVSLYDSGDDEYHPADSIHLCNDADVLDTWHPVISFNHQ